MVEKIRGFGNQLKAKIFDDSVNAGTVLAQPNEEIKTALQLKIFGRQQIDGATFYVIRTWLIYSPGEISDAIRKRYSQFYELHERLQELGFQSLPSIPKKQFYMTEKDTQERQAGLENYLKQLINRKDTRNSEPIIDFLNLDDFCPEILFNVPQLIIKKDYGRAKSYVNSCIFLEQHNLYIISLTDRSTKQSRFEIYSFRQTGLIQDKYRLKTGDQVSGGEGGSRQSVVELLQSPMNAGRKNTLFSSIPETKDVKSAAEVRVQSAMLTSSASSHKKMEKLLATEEHSFKINSMTYHQDFDMLSIGLSNGQIVNYTLEIESFAFNNDYNDTSTSPTGNLDPRKKMSKHQQRQLLFQEGNMLASAKYIQSESDTPELDVENGRFSVTGQEENKGEPARKDSTGSSNNQQWLKKFRLMTHSCAQIHSCVKSMVVDQHRGLLYSTGKDRIIHCQNLQQKETVGVVKTSNARPVGLQIDVDLERLYVSTREGMVLVFEVKNPKSIMIIHTMSLCKQLRTGNPTDFVKQMDLDQDRNILICRSKAGFISVVQLINKGCVKSTIIEQINSYESSKDDALARFKWLSRMSCYCEGTQKGYVRIRDIEKGGECILNLQTGFQDRVRLIHYNKLKNVLFAASKDGQFRIWKIPHEWRSKVIDDREMNAEYERRRVERQIRNTATSQDR